MIATAPSTPIAQQARPEGNDALAPYWERTLGLFAGSRVRVCLADGRTREGVLHATSLDVGQGPLVPIPLGLVCSVTQA